jgi:hypothetical protein
MKLNGLIEYRANMVLKPHFKKMINTILYLFFRKNMYQRTSAGHQSIILITQ